MGSVNNVSNSLLSAFDSALQGAGLTPNTNASGVNGAGKSSVGQPQDNGQISPLAQILSTLQQLQQSNPTQYEQVARQIATNLQTAAQTAQSDGNSAAATQLNQLAADFSKASQSGQLPNIQDLAQALGGHHHHHGHHSQSASDADSSSSASSTSGSTSSSASSSTPGSTSSSASSSTPAGTSTSSNSSQTLSQFLAALEANGSQNDSLNPTTIILDTLSSAGISLNS